MWFSAQDRNKTIVDLSLVAYIRQVVNQQFIEIKFKPVYRNKCITLYYYDDDQIAHDYGYLLTKLRSFNQSKLEQK